jgi:hypothetical protein
VRDDVARRERDVLRAGAAVELEVLVDLRLALALGRLVDRELDRAVAVVTTFDISAEYSVEIASSEKWIISSSRRRPRRSRPTRPCAELDVADDVVDGEQPQSRPRAARRRRVAGQERRRVAVASTNVCSVSP